MLASRISLPFLLTVLCFVISVPLVIKNPVYAVLVTILCLLSIATVVGKFDLPRILTITVVPLFAAFNLINSNTGICVLVILMGFYLAAWIGSEDYRIKNPNDSWKMLLFFVVWFFYAAIQTMWIVQTDRTWYHLQTIILGIALIWFMSRIVSTARWLEILYISWGISLLATVFVGWWEVLTNQHLPGSGANFYQLKNVTTVNFFNPNDYCFFLIVSLPVMFYWIKGHVILKLLGLFMLISTFFFTYTDGARFIVLILLVLLFAFMIELGKKHRKLMILFVCIMASYAYLYADVILKAVGDVFTLGTNDNSTNVRKFLNTSAWQVFQDHILGVGPGKLESYMPKIGIGSNVHNFWLEILVNYGFVIFLGFVSFFIVTLYKLYAAWKSNTEDIRKLITPILWSAIIFIPACIQSSSVFAFSITWFLFTTMICATNIVTTKNQGNKEQPHLRAFFMTKRSDPMTLSAQTINVASQEINDSEKQLAHIAQNGLLLKHKPKETLSIGKRSKSVQPHDGHV